MRHRLFDTFTGPFALIQNDDGRLMTSWLNAEVRLMLAASRQDKSLLPDLSRCLKRYFDGMDVDFSDVPTPQGGEFFVRCWNACREIERGTMCTYAELADLAGSPAAARAAGQAMRNNQLPIIIPCHRVIGSSGKLHGFGGSCDHTGNELAVKSSLLKMEGALVDPSSRGRRNSASARRTLAVAV